MLHSALSERERAEAWDRVRAGDALAVIGPRSAAFAPVADPGLFIVDEEHDSSYKQRESPRYDAREVVALRARENAAALRLRVGDALGRGRSTPPSAAASRSLRLPERIAARPLPEVDDRGPAAGDRAARGEGRPALLPARSSSACARRSRAASRRSSFSLAAASPPFFCAATAATTSGARAAASPGRCTTGGSGSSATTAASACPGRRAVRSAGGICSRRSGPARSAWPSASKSSFPGVAHVVLDRDTARRRGAAAVIEEFQSGRGRVPHRDADGRQGPRLSGSDGRRRPLGRHAAPLPGLPLRREDVPAPRAGGRPGRPRRLARHRPRPDVSSRSTRRSCSRRGTTPRRSPGRSSSFGARSSTRPSASSRRSSSPPPTAIAPSPRRASSATALRAARGRAPHLRPRSRASRTAPGPLALPDPPPRGRPAGGPRRPGGRRARAGPGRRADRGGRGPAGPDVGRVPARYNDPVNSENGHFEEPIIRLRRRIEELSALPDDAGHRREIEKLREKLDRVSREIYSSLTPWQKTLVARHPARPYTLDYVQSLLTDFVELHGDRKFADDPAVVAGFGAVSGPGRRGRRPPEGAGHQGEDPPQLRHAAAGRLPQGPARDGARREVRPADPLLHRHGRRLPRHRRRGARPGRGDRRQPPGDGAVPRADRRRRSPARAARAGRSRSGSATAC